MGKGYKGVPCVYCIDGVAEDGDHVISRQFFPQENRANLPKVPACKACNNDKSKLEHYLTTVLPFGGQHDDAGEILTKLVPRRLARNNKLHSAIIEGLSHHIVSTNGGPWMPSMAIPFDGRNIERFYEYLVRGLAWHHWKLLLGPDVTVKAGYLVEAGRLAFERLLTLDAADSVSADLGNGVFVYEAAQSKETQELTVWKMTFYGGVLLGGDPKAPHERCTSAYGFTAPKKWPASKELQSLLGG
jgi:hypothetical protein